MTARDPAEIDLRDYIKVLYRRRWYAIATFLAVVVVTAVITFTSTPIYESTAEIMIQQNLGTGGISALLGDFAAPFAAPRQDIADRIHMMRSRSTLERAQEILNTDPDFAAARSRQVAAHQSGEQDAGTTGSTGLITVEELGNAIQLRNAPNSNLISIAVTALSPAEATAIANALAVAYQQIERELTVASIRSVQEFLTEQAKVVETVLATSEEGLIAFQQEMGMLLEEGLLINRVSRIEGMLIEGRVELADKQDQLATLNVFLDGIREEFLTRMLSPEEGTPLLVELQDKMSFLMKLQHDIAEWELERIRYLQEENYVQVRILEQRIINQRRELEDTAARQFTLLEIVPQFEQLIETQLDLTLEIIALENRVKILEEMLLNETATLMAHGLALARLKREFDITETVHGIILQEYQKARIAEAAEIGSVQVINAAELPRSPIRPNKRMNLLVATFLGLFSGVGVAFMREYLDNTVKSSGDVEKALGLIPLGNVPRIGHPTKKWLFEQVEETLLPHLNPGTPEFESIMAIASNLRFASPDKTIDKILVTSAVPGEGKSTTSANLAFSLALSKDRVLLVDADFRRPILEKTLHVSESNGRGLSDLILGESSIEAIVKEIKIGEFPAIWFLPAGSSVLNPTRVLSAERFDEVLQLLAEQFDAVVIDSPPVNIAVDALLLASKSDGVILVVEAGKTKKEETERAKGDLERYKADILGVVLNKVPAHSTGYYSGYYYGGYHRKDTAIDPFIKIARKIALRIVGIKRFWRPESKSKR